MRAILPGKLEMELKLERTEELLTRRTGLVLVDRFGKKIDLASKIDRAFGRPGSNRGMAASEFVLTLTQMLIDGAMRLEDVREFERDEAYKQMTGRDHYQMPPCGMPVRLRWCTIRAVKVRFKYTFSGL